MSNEVLEPAILRADKEAAFLRVLRGVVRAAFRSGIPWARVKELAEEAANAELARAAAYGDRLQKQVAAELGTTPRTLQRLEPLTGPEREGLRREYQRRLHEALCRVPHALTAAEAAAVVEESDARFAVGEWGGEATALLDDLVERGAATREQRHARLAPVYTVDRSGTTGAVPLASAVDHAERICENVSRFAEVAAAVASWVRAANVGRRGRPALPAHLRVTDLSVDVDPSLPPAELLRLVREGIVEILNRHFRAPADGDDRRARVRVTLALSHLSEELSHDAS